MSNEPSLPHSPAAQRNGPPILAALRGLLAADARVLEIASGTGQHAAGFASQMPGWSWQPSEADASLLPAIAARCAGHARVQAPVHLDLLATTRPQGLTAFDAVFCANLLHISPWDTCRALMLRAVDALRPEGWLVIYGPFIVDGVATAESNLAFDADLRARNPAWGLRRLAEVEHCAQQVGLALSKAQDMPAKNLMLWFRNPGTSGR